MPPPTIITTPRTLTLSSGEAAVRELFVDAAQEIDKDRPDDDRLVLRFVGGWVRDRLLGLLGVDIDVGISNMTGYELATWLSEYISANMDTYGAELGGVHKIKRNPQKSKHLETASVEVLGLDIDFANLRSETYSGDSRIPHMEFGTPEQDALRRDCTINALFYNLHTELVEDFTGLGLQDLAARLIRTPLPPKETFTDDPLRILRLIRFYSRLGFTIVPEAMAAMKLPEIKICSFSSKTQIITHIN
ncbi:tRNA nucleotidyltransferase [Tuber brumale]|nr:tRNA nucleotidyltransferase [Tuber brumale]